MYRFCCIQYYKKYTDVNTHKNTETEIKKIHYSSPCYKHMHGRQRLSWVKSNYQDTARNWRHLLRSMFLFRSRCTQPIHSRFCRSQHRTPRTGRRSGRCTRRCNQQQRQHTQRLTYFRLVKLNRPDTPCTKHYRLRFCIFQHRTPRTGRRSGRCTRRCNQQQRQHTQHLTYFRRVKLNRPDMPCTRHYRSRFCRCRQNTLSKEHRRAL